MSPQKFNTADDEGPSPALTPHQEGLIVGSPPPEGTAPEILEAQQRAQHAKAIREARESMTRRSWYTATAAADAFQAAVDDLHHHTRVPKHEVVAALLRAAVEQAPKVERKLHAQIAPMRRVRDVSP